jgi:RNA polymerase sigma factor (sigma-70 family)
MAEAKRSEVTDGELLARWADGDRVAGQHLIERHFTNVYGFFRGCAASERQDLVQQTFLACVEGRARYQQQGSFRAFLLGIARHQLYAYYRQQRRECLDVSLSPLRDLGTTPTGLIARREGEHRLREAIQRIPLEAQVVLELAYWQGLDGPEIAEALNVPINTVYSRVHRAKAYLGEKLRELNPDQRGNARVLAKLPRRSEEETSEDRSPSTLSADKE